MKKNKENRGITLIALVITIIVLLILAGVSISMLAGDNGVLTKASDAKIVNAIGKVKDEINLKTAEAMSDYYELIYASNSTSEFSNAGIVNAIMQKLKSDFDGKDDADYAVSVGGISEGATIVVQSKAQPTIRAVGTMQENGLITWVDKFKKSESQESVGLAKDILTLTVIEDGKLNSPYVNYPSARGTIKCKVLYNDNDDKGLQIVSVNPVTTVTLGSTDPNPNVKGKMGSVERAQSSYNRVITTLNEKAEEYKGTTDGSILAIDARCIGSDPINKNYPDNLTGNAKNAEMFVANNNRPFMDDYNGKFFKTDTHYTTDYNRLEEINSKLITDAQVVSREYWLASRGVNCGTEQCYFYLRRVYHER